MKKFLALHEASRECIWLRSLIQNTQKTCGLTFGKIYTTTIYEDNTACITQLKDGYIKRERTKHISPKFLFTHDLQKSGDISIQHLRSCDNLLDLLSKSLPNKTFSQLVRKIDLHHRIHDRSAKGEK